MARRTRGPSRGIGIFKSLRLSVSAVLLIAALTALCAGQNTNQARYTPVLDNDAVTVLGLELPPRFRAPSYQNEHDVLWIGLNDATVTFLDSDRRETQVQFRPGDVRFFRSFSTQQIANQSGGAFRGVMIELKQRAPGAPACTCGSPVEKAICGCADAAFLPKLWAVAVHSITIAGTTLTAGEAFAQPVERGDTLLVAVTPLELADDGDGVSATSIQLQPGGAKWIKAGTHRLKNVGKTDARFVTVEF